LAAVIDESENKGKKERHEPQQLEQAAFIARDRASCEECKRLLRETSLVVEMSAVGKHVSGFIRFESEQKEKAYEEHMTSAHGLLR
jgi:hypothetical protein